MTPLRKPTTAEASPPAELAGDGPGAKLVRVGPTLHGWVYRASAGTAFCHVLPVEGPPLAWKHEVKKRAAEVAAGRTSRVVDHVVNPIKAGQSGTSDYYFIHYDPGEPTQSLADLLDGRAERPLFSERIVRAIADRLGELGRLEGLDALPQLLAGNSPGLRVMAVAWVFQAVARWGQQGRPLLPMPAQIVFNAAGQPLLLGGTPYLPLARVEPLFAEPQRILYLPPELIGSRGTGAWDWGRADRYALGVLLHQCLYPPAAIADPETALLRTVNGTLLAADRRRGTTPFWLTRMPALRQADEWVGRLTASNPAARAATDLGQVGSVLEVCGQGLTPSIAVRALVGSETPYAGLALLQEVLLTDESYEYLVLAARTAIEPGVERALDALDLLARAVALNGARPDARLARVRLLSRAREFAALFALFEKESPRFDAIIWGDFNSLDADAQLEARQPLAEYLVWREQYPLAAERIHKWLFDTAGQYLWHDMRMNEAYAEALLGLATDAVRSADAGAAARVRAVRDHLNTWRDSLQTLRLRGEIDSRDVQVLGQSMAAMDMAVYRLEQTLLKVPEPPLAPAEEPT